MKRHWRLPHASIPHAVAALPLDLDPLHPARVRLVERRADPGDGRASLLAATDEGVRVIETERHRRARVIASVLSGWSPDDRDALTSLLARFRDDYQSFENQGES